jgi:hypothetical protein
MDREVYLVAAEELQLLNQALVFVRMLLVWLCRTASNRLSVIGGGEAAAALRAVYSRICGLVPCISLGVLRWAACYGTMAMLYVEDLTVFARLRNRWPAPFNRSLDDLETGVAYRFTGLYIHQLRQLLVYWRVPDTFTHGGFTFTGEECFLVYWHAMTRGEPWTEMSSNAGRQIDRWIDRQTDRQIDASYAQDRWIQMDAQIDGQIGRQMDR